MVSCPQCKATLPPSAVQCQFCGAAIAVPPPPPPGQPSGRAALTRNFGGRAGARPLHAGRRDLGWVPVAYNLIALWWIVDGALSVYRGVSGGQHEVSGIGAIFGGLTAVVGLGLLARIDVVRGIVNVLSFLQILSGLLDVVLLFFLAPITGAWGAIALILAFVRIGTAGLMIFLIGETETRGPNF